MTPGRSSAAQATQGLGQLGATSQRLAGKDEGIQDSSRNTGGQIVNSMVNTNGGLSPLVSKQLSNQEGMIGKTYSGLAGAGLRGLAARGMGSAPTGAASSIANTAARQTGEENTGAVGRAFGAQNDLNLAGLGYEQGQQQLYDPLKAVGAGTNAYSAESNAAVNQGKLGSTLGDAMKLGGAALSAIPGLGTFGKVAGAVGKAAG